MAQRHLGPVLRHLEKLIGRQRTESLTDRQLLRRFAGDRDEEAFALLVHRHGAMVLGVCRRLLRDCHDADDAFQATFLVLARRAGSLRWHDSIGNWLYGVAQRIALKARGESHRRQARLRPIEAVLDCEEHSSPLTEAVRRDLHQVLDEELRQLPNKYRAPLVLCYLEGKTNEEAARELGWPAGSMSRHLARARDLLRGRLERREVSLSTALLGDLLAEKTLSAAVPATLETATIQAAVLFGTPAAALAGAASIKAIALAEGVLQAMLTTKLQILLVVLMTAGVFGVGTGGWLARSESAGNQAGLQKKEPDAKPQPGAVDEGGGEGTPKIEAKADMTASAIRAKLAKPISLEKVDGNTPLRDAIEFLSQSKADVQILIDTEAFKEDLQMHEVEAQPIKLVKMTNVPFGTVLRMVLAQVQGTYVVRPGFIEITTPNRTRPELWGPENRKCVPLVSADFQKRPLEEALQELADLTGITVVLDARSAEEAGKLKITARLNNVPIDTAVRMVADMGGLKAVVMDGALYVTDVYNAEQLQEEEEKRRAGAALRGM